MTTRATIYNDLDAVEGVSIAAAFVNNNAGTALQFCYLAQADLIFYNIYVNLDRVEEVAQLLRYSML